MARGFKNFVYPLACAFISFTLQSKAHSQSATVPVGDVFFQRATTLEYSKSYSQILRPDAFAAYENAANLGSDKAMIRLAQSSKAEGNAEKTKFWYEKANEKGNLIAAVNLGKIYIKEGNCARGLPLVEKGKDTLVFDAKYYLARILYEKTCSDAPNDLVVRINEDAANSGIVFSVFRLAKMYYYGEYTPKNLPRAWAFAKISSLKSDQKFDGEEFKKADGIALLETIDKEIKANGLELNGWNELKAICEKGPACTSIRIKDLPSGLKINIQYPPAPMPPPPPMPVAGFNSMAMAYDKNISHEQYQIMNDAHSAAVKLVQEYRKSNKGKIDYNVLRGFFKKAVEIGNPISIHTISRLYYEEDNIKLGREWLEKAASNGSYLAQWEWANFLIEDKKDCPLIAKYLENAWRVAKPQYYNMVMGKLYNGEVCADFRNEVKAINSYTRAANVGIVAAMVKLSEIYARKELPDYDFIRALTWARIAYALSPERGFFAPPEIKALKKFLEAGYKTLNDEAKQQVISDTNAICSAYATCNAISDADIMKLQTFDIN